MMANYLTVALVLLAALSAQAGPTAQVAKHAMRPLAVNGAQAPAATGLGQLEGKFSRGGNLLLLVLAALWIPMSFALVNPTRGQGTLQISRAPHIVSATYSAAVIRGP